MKLINLPPLQKIMDASCFLTITNHRRNRQTLCGLPFFHCMTGSAYHQLNLSYEDIDAERHDAGQIQVCGLSNIGISRNYIMCFSACIDYEIVDLESDLPFDPKEEQRYLDFIEHMTGVEVKNGAKLDVLIFADLIHEKSIMIADNGPSDRSKYYGSDFFTTQELDRIMAKAGFEKWRKKPMSD